jgi:enoyl-CoA hydratase/long-chain 3-hydroxyacyl-CoA dehydrogenase
VTTGTNVKYSVDNDGIATVVLDQQGAKVNTLSLEMSGEFLALMNKLVRPHAWPRGWHGSNHPGEQKAGRRRPVVLRTVQWVQGAHPERPLFPSPSWQESDPKVRAAVLMSGKPDSFIAGADINMFTKCTVRCGGANIPGCRRQGLTRQGGGWADGGRDGSHFQARARDV